MSRASIFLFILLFSFQVIFAQTSPNADSSQVLQEVIVKGYEQNRKLIETGASVGVIKKEQFLRYAPGSMLSAMNTIPGVRMEERSPGSYRLSIRGSSLRSPFGVRNVKVYLDGIPFTDAGGNTYLNQLSPDAISSLEILKGPGSSVYGAGTGGVVLLNTMPVDTGRFARLELSGGSYQAKNISVNAGIRNDHFASSISYSHQQADGFRQQSAMRRDLFAWNARITASEKQSVAIHILYGDLYYQTPGALTLTEYNANNKQARPAAGGFPGAVQNKAAIYQKTLWAGLTHHYKFSDHFENQTSVYANYSTVRNPAVRNYEERNEPGIGARTVFSWKGAINNTTLNITGGGEFQQGYPHIRVANNKFGNPDSLQTKDEVRISQAGVFLQAELNFKGGWIFTAGGSLNTTKVLIDRVSVFPVFTFQSNFHNEIAPRVSILKKLNNHLSVYALASKGFSPPTVAELLPSTTVINTSLQAEQGVNVEGGIKGSFIRSRLTLDINTYSFRLQNTIAQRRDASGADYFVNTGTSRQKGIEAALNLNVFRNSSQFIRSLNLWTDYTYQHFRYGSFKQLTNDFSGNQIPGTTPNALASGVAVVSALGVYVNISYYYSDHINLNDANSAIASPYQIAGFRGGYRIMLGRHFSADVYLSGDNMFDERYSLGNDINAAANRYYNIATGRNFQCGVILKAN